MVTTTDPTVVWTVIVGSAISTGGLLLLCKVALDAALQLPAPLTAPHTPTPALPTGLADRHPHAQPAAPDETAPLTTVHVGRHRKGTHRCI